MRARKTETDIRQEQIVQAALELIGENGVYGLNMAAIAERVGVVPSALYRHFKSKEDVLDGVLAALKARLLANVAAVKREAPEAMERLKSLVMRHARLLSENRAIPLVVFSDGIYAGRPERKAMISGIITEYLEEIQKIIETGQREGAVRRDVLPVTASVMFLGMILPAVVLWNVSDGVFDIVAHAENAWPAFARCISVKT